MSHFGPTECCGLDEYTGLNQNRDVELIPYELMMYSIAENSDCDPSWSSVRVSTQVVMTAVQPLSAGTHRANYHYGNDKKFLALVKKHKLGTVVSSPLKINPNSRNKVKCYLWSVSVTGVKRYLKGEFKKNKQGAFERLNSALTRQYRAPNWW